MKNNNFLLLDAISPSKMSLKYLFLVVLRNILGGATYNYHGGLLLVWKYLLASAQITGSGF